ncbi:MAG: DUF5132 domain-containing protein [Acidobacteriota bacterium]|nr:DUF5132 domain-containing protein [Acidobacteriota bacterium]
MAKAHADTIAHSGKTTAIQTSPKLEPDTNNVLANRVATVAAVGIGVALIEAELIPGMLIGVAAMLAPNLLPRIGNALRPFIKGAMKAGYAVVEKTKETVGEANEHMQDIVAEVKSERQTEDAEPIAHSSAPAPSRA